MKGNIYKLPRFIVETLIYLIRENSERTTSEIFEYVKQRIPKEFLSKSDESNKKTLLKVLNFFSAVGLVEQVEGKGR